MVSHFQRSRINIVHDLPPETWSEILSSVNLPDVINFSAAGSSYLKSIAEAHPKFWRGIQVALDSNVHLITRQCETAAAVGGRTIKLTLDLAIWTDGENALVPEPESQRTVQQAEHISNLVAITTRFIAIADDIYITVSPMDFVSVDPWLQQAAPKLDCLHVGIHNQRLLYGDEDRIYTLPDNLFLGQAPRLASISLFDAHPPESSQVWLPSVRTFDFSGCVSSNGLTLPTGFQTLLPQVTSLKLSGETIGDLEPDPDASLTSSATLTDVEIDFIYGGENARICNILPTQHLKRLRMTTNAYDKENILAFSRKIQDLSSPLSVTLAAQHHELIEVTFTSHAGPTRPSRTLMVDTSQPHGINTESTENLWRLNEPDFMRASVTKVLNLLSMAARQRKIQELIMDVSAGPNVIAECLKQLPDAEDLVLVAHSGPKRDWLLPCNSWSPNADAVCDVRLGSLRKVAVDMNGCIDQEIRLSDDDVDTIVTLGQRLPLPHLVQFKISPDAQSVFEQFYARSNDSDAIAEAM